MEEYLLYREIDDLEEEIDYLVKENERLKQELAHYKKLVDIILNKGEHHE